MKTRTRIGRTSTTTREMLAARLLKSLGDQADGGTLWKVLGESPLLQNLRRDPKLGKDSAEVVFVAKDRSHCLLIDCKAHSAELTESQTFLHLNQLAHYLKDSQFPIKTASVVFFLPTGSPNATKLLATFNDGYRLPAAKRKSSLTAVGIRGQGTRVAKNAYKYQVSFTYKEEKFDLDLTVKVVEGTLTAPEPVPTPPSAKASPTPPPLPAAPPPVTTADLRRYKDLLDEGVTARAVEAWYALGEAPSLQRTRGAPGAGGPDLVYLSRDRAHCLLVDIHLRGKPDEAQSSLHLPALIHLLSTRGYAIKTVSLVFLLAPGSAALADPPFTERYAMAPEIAARMKALGAWCKTPGQRVAKNAVKFTATVVHGMNMAEIPLTVKFVEGPKSIYQG